MCLPGPRGVLGTRPACQGSRHRTLYGGSAPAQEGGFHGLGAQRPGDEFPGPSHEGSVKALVFLSHLRLKPNFRSRTVQWVKLYSC